MSLSSSDRNRDTLGMDEFFAFDGDPDRVERVTVDYHHACRTRAKAPNSDDVVHRDWSLTERLVVDRASRTAEYLQDSSAGFTFSQKLQSGDVAELLDALEPDVIFGEIEGNPEDVVDDPLDTRGYTITVDFRHQPQRILRGSYDKKALPGSWGEFVSELSFLFEIHGMGELLDPAVYGRARRRTSDLMYCAVEFEEDGRRYYYISDDEEIAVGDFVLVPAGKENRRSVAQVVEIGFYQEDQVPFPVERTKYILEKLSEPEDWDEERLDEGTKRSCHSRSRRELASDALIPRALLESVDYENSAIELDTPFGKIRVKLDGKPICFPYEVHEPSEGPFPDVDGTYRIGVEVQQDGKYHSLKLELSGEGAPGELEPGEMLEALSFYRNGGKITLGCYAAFGEMEEYGLDFDGQWDDNGIEVLIFPSTRTHTYRFGVCWINTCTEETDVQTWFGADPSI